MTLAHLRLLHPLLLLPLLLLRRWRCMLHLVQRT
jgi:hypothetical protein